MHVRKLAGLLATGGALLAIAATPAGADPKGETFPLDCDNGNTYTVITSGNGEFTPAHNADGTQTFIPLSFGEFTGTFTDNEGNVFPVDEPAVDKGQSNRNGKGDVTCTFAFSGTEEEGTFEAQRIGHGLHHAARRQVGTARDAGGPWRPAGIDRRRSRPCRRPAAPPSAVDAARQLALAAASRPGATCFLRLITPGSSIAPSCDRLVEGTLGERLVAGDEQARVLGEDVGEHEREEDVVAALAMRLGGGEQLLGALEDRARRRSRSARRSASCRCRARTP